jgi:acetyltransferase
VEYEVLNGLLRPTSIAVIGASNKEGKIGYTVVKNLIDSQYQGPIYPINPNDEEVLGSRPTVLSWMFRGRSMRPW